MHQLSPDAWFSGLRNKNVYTPEKGEQDRVNLQTYLQNHGFPQARIGAPRRRSSMLFSNPSSTGHYRPIQPGLTVGLPVEAGAFYAFGRLEMSATLRQQMDPKKKGDLISPDVTPGRPFSNRPCKLCAATGNSGSTEMPNDKKAMERTDYEPVQPSIPTHIASVKFDFEPSLPLPSAPNQLRGNQRSFGQVPSPPHPPLSEGQPLDEYAI